MADIIKCPVCGESNPAGEEFCQFCQSRLRPLTGNLKGADAPISPGQAPTKKNTADLEPILPQWLRDARNSAREMGQEDTSNPVQQQPSGPPQPVSGSDLLAGLHSQSSDNDEDDIPDWLTSITGTSSKSKKPQSESSEVRWVELGDKSDFPQDERGINPDTSPWLSGVNPSTAQPDEKDELGEWFRDASGRQKSDEPEGPSSFEVPLFAPLDDDTPDWLRQMVADEEAKNESAPPNTPADTFNPASASSSEQPDWLNRMVTGDAAQSADPSAYSGAGLGEAGAAAGSSSMDVPDWLKGLESETPAIQASASDDDWMKVLPTNENDKPIQGATPEWLKEEKPASSEETAVPSWLSSAPTPAASTPEQEPEQSFAQQDDSLGDVPDWLRASAPQSSIYSEPAEGEGQAFDAPLSDSPDWLNAFKSAETPVPPSSNMPPPEAISDFSTFTTDPETKADMDALFTDMPDWLSSAAEAASTSEPTPIHSDALAPGELPSWVQAMRPVDSGASGSSSSSMSGDQTLESRGALAGLQGVLPSVPGFAPTSKPKAYSIKLQASDEQQAHAALLEQILAAETAPIPIASFSPLVTSRNLRWLLSFIFFAILIPVSFLGAQTFALPLSAPSREISGALQVSQSIPQGAPVLVAFDYEPARVGEMEVTAAPLFDQMILLSHPHLTFISTNETGAILAERFISGPLAGHNYQSGAQYLNLGYLPGGQMGIRAFAQNPPLTIPFDISLNPNPLNGIASISQFAAFIIVTDNADSARTWIEQTISSRGTIPLVVISSAQAAPMIQPYYESHQISGLVGGLYGGAVFEQNNANRPGTARTYWDSYSIGMLLAMLLIAGGGLWNLGLGLRDRVAAREER